MFIVQEGSQNEGQFRLVASALDRLLIVDSPSNSVQCLDLPKLPSRKGDQLQNNSISCIESSKDRQYIAVTTEGRLLAVFDQSFTVIKSIVLLRGSSKVCFSPANDILVADRTGDVYMYKMADQNNQPLLLLGHLSVILDMLVTRCGKYIITCDRDEKIRVSLYPNAYNIATFCLGHEEFVSCLALLDCCNVLLSGSGDGSVRLWNYLQGKQLSIINTVDLVDAISMESFAKQMDVEKVDVKALPIADMQVREQGELVTLAISLYNTRKIFLYSLKIPTMEHSLKHTIDFGAENCPFSLANRLYVLSNELEVYEVDGHSLRAVSCGNAQQSLAPYGSLLASNPCDITVWYKRKYDNVQEYMERKKLRLESK